MNFITDFELIYKEAKFEFGPFIEHSSETKETLSKGIVNVIFNTFANRFKHCARLTLIYNL